MAILVAQTVVSQPCMGKMQVVGLWWYIDQRVVHLGQGACIPVYIYIYILGSDVPNFQCISLVHVDIRMPIYISLWYYSRQSPVLHPLCAVLPLIPSPPLTQVLS